MDTNKMREQTHNEFDAWLDGYEKDREANGWVPLEPYVRKHMRNAFVASREALVPGLAQLKAENEELRKDAERYRWLREYTVETLPLSGALQALDCRIDAARAKEANRG